MGGMTSSTSTSTPKMPGYVKDIYKDVYKDVGKAYNKFGKNGMPVFSEPTTAGLSDQQTSALTGMNSTALANSGGAGMSGPLQSILNNGGFNSGQITSMDQTRGLANNSGLNSLINSSDGLTADQRLVADRYRGEMSSPFDINANPAYAQVRQRALDAGAQGVTGQAAKMGRLGGAANQNILARAQSDTAANMDLGEYRNWQQRGDTAAGNLAGLSGAGLGQRASAIDQKSGLESSLFNMNQAGLDNMAKAYQTLQAPYQTQMGVGNITQQQQQNVINDKMRMFDAQNPMNAYQQFLGLASGMPTGTTQTTNPSTLQMLLGGGLGTMGLLGGMGMF